MNNAKMANVEQITLPEDGTVIISLDTTGMLQSAVQDLIRCWKANIKQAKESGPTATFVLISHIGNVSITVIK